MKMSLVESLRILVHGIANIRYHHNLLAQLATQNCSIFSTSWLLVDKFSNSLFRPWTKCCNMESISGIWINICMIMYKKNGMKLERFLESKGIYFLLFIFMSICDLCVKKIILCIFHIFIGISFGIRWQPVYIHAHRFMFWLRCKT